MARRGRGEGSIYRATDGRWVGQLRVAGRKRVVYGETRQEVQTGLARLRRDVEQGATAGSERQTMAQYLDEWMEWKQHRVGESSLRRYRELVELHVLPTLGKVPVVKLTAQQVERLEAQKLAEGLSRGTVARLHVTISYALRHAESLGLVPRNVARLVTPPRPRRVPMRVLDEEQVRHLLEVCRSSPVHGPYYPIYLLAVTTGLRRGEILALHWEDVDLKRRVAEVRFSLKWRTGQGWEAGSPKSDASHRTVAFPVAVARALAEHRVGQLAARMLVGEAWVDNGLVFCDALGEPIQANHLLQRRFRPLLEAAGLPAIRFHDLRHTAATLVLRGGIHPKVVQEMLGHTSIAMTLDLYSHVMPNMQADAAAMMDRVLGWLAADEEEGPASERLGEGYRKG